MDENEDTNIKVPALGTPKYQKKEIEVIAKSSFSTATKTIMASNLVLSLVLSVALQYLWGMINSLQLMMLGIFIDSFMPPNAKAI